MATYILIHGAWHGGWCWEGLVPLLQQAGHDVLAPDLPGMGADRTPLRDDVLEQWTDFVAELALAAFQPVILVGHSRGGIVISEVAERIPGEISQLVYLTAFLLQAGESLVKVAGRHPEVGPGPAIVPSNDGFVHLDPERASSIFYNLTPAEMAQRAAERLCPEPAAAVATPLKVTANQFGKVRRAYIEATEDRAISLQMQREMQAALPCEPVITLQSDHSPFLSAVPELASALLSLAP